VRILLDECVNAGVKAAFPGHAIKTVAEAGWRGTKDGPLLALAQKSFDVFLTIDRGVEHQQALKKLGMGILIAHIPNNEIASYRPLFPQLLRAAETVRMGQVVHLRRAT
jgi:hypothetical protein